MENKNLRIFLAGDVMIGRGIDQILSYTSKFQLFESYVTDAREYVLLAESVNGKINFPVSMDYIWGEALTVWDQLKPDIKIINLETSITQSDDYMPGKGIHYRMHPSNISVLTSPAGIDVCTLANNHVLDWGAAGLIETMSTLKNAGIQFSGVGENIKQAMQPVIFKLKSNKRVLIFSAGMESSGVPSFWEATSQLPGVYYLPEINQDVLLSIADNIKEHKKSGDLVIFSIHWGGNWGYEISNEVRKFAHDLIEVAKVDVIFGHSSHHPKSIELFQGKPILYGCGDFINDYEGISGHEEYRGDLSLMYFLDIDCDTQEVRRITLVPLQIKNFRLNPADKESIQWMQETLNQSSKFAVQFIQRGNYLVYSK